jgi:hypothetical protein
MAESEDGARSGATTSIVVLPGGYPNPGECRSQLSQVLKAVEAGALGVTASVCWRGSRGR